jgi:hypothetical protein
MTAEYFVTYKIAFANGDFAIYEFFRGSKHRCDDIARSFAGTTDERQPVKFSAAIVGKADEWDEFLDNA